MGVSSVVNLCDILSRDSDACPTAAETAAVTAARASLEKRWKNICDLCLQRKQRSDFLNTLYFKMSSELYKLLHNT